MIAHLLMARIADALEGAWGTANTAILAEGRGVLISDAAAASRA